MQLRVYRAGNNSPLGCIILAIVVRLHDRLLLQSRNTEFYFPALKHYACSTIITFYIEFRSKYFNFCIGCIYFEVLYFPCSSDMSYFEKCLTGYPYFSFMFLPATEIPDL